MYIYLRIVLERERERERETETERERGESEREREKDKCCSAKNSFTFLTVNQMETPSLKHKDIFLNAGEDLNLYKSYCHGYINYQ